MALIALACWLATACGPTAHRPNGPDTQDGLTAAATAFANSVIAHDGPASYAYLSSDCRSQWKLVDWTRNLQAEAAIVEGPSSQAVDWKVDHVSIREFSQATAQVAIHLMTPNGAAVTQPGDDAAFTAWTYEAFGWRATTCTRAGDSSQGAPAPTTTADPLVTGEATALPHDTKLSVTESAITRETGTPTAVVVVHNPNATDMALGVAVNIDLLDAHGTVVGQLGQRITGIYANGDGVAVAPIDATGATSLRVDAKVESFQPPPERMGTLSAVNTSCADDAIGRGTVFSGMVASTGTTRDQTTVVVVLHDASGTLRAAAATNADDVPPNGQRAFAVTLPDRVPSAWSASYIVEFAG